MHSMVRRSNGFFVPRKDICSVTRQMGALRAQESYNLVVVLFYYINADCKLWHKMVRRSNGLVVPRKGSCSVTRPVGALRAQESII